jgi:hypothetical protein
MKPCSERVCVLSLLVRFGVVGCMFNKQEKCYYTAEEGKAGRNHCGYPMKSCTMENRIGIY